MEEKRTYYFFTRVGHKIYSASEVSKNLRTLFVSYIIQNSKL